MITDAAREVAALAGKGARLPLGKPAFQPKERYKSFELDKKNFKKIVIDKTQDTRFGKAEPVPNLPLASSGSGPKTAFLDGGNLPIIKAPSFAVHFERVYSCCFKGRDRIKLELPRIEFFAVAVAVGGDDVKYQVKLIPLNPEHKKYLPKESDLLFDSYDETFREGQERIEIGRVGDIARSFAEWNYAEFVIGELGAGDVFVRDGTLHAPYTNQTAYAEKAYEAARKKGALFCGVSKTSQLYTTSGLPLSVAISRLARENKIAAPWYYENIVEITDPAHKADMSFARLNQESEYAFRVEILKGQEEEKERAMSALAENSKDISFPGYPYGLLDADKNARVSYEELESLRMLLFSEISKGGGFKEFKDLLLGSDAHDWLNRVV